MTGDQFGPLSGLVGSVGSLVAAVAAIALTWRGRARWEPSETDVASGPQRVGGLATAVLIAILYVITRPGETVGLLPVLAMLLLLVCVASLLAYSYITSTNTYDDIKHKRKIIGGFKLTPKAKRDMRLQKITLQRYLSGVDSDPDEVWPRDSRALAKVVFVVLYLLLVISGTVAIATAAILIEKGSGGGPVPTPSPSPAPSTSTSPTATPSFVSPTADITAAPSFTPAPTPIVNTRTLRWVDAAEATAPAIDGGVFEVGKPVWLAELFPGAPPSGFQVLERVDPSLPKELRDALKNFAFPQFKPVVSGFRAVSDTAWKLPVPIQGIGYRTFYFVDATDGTPVESGTITSGTLRVTVAGTGGGCEQAGQDGTFAGQLGDSCIALSLAAALDPTFDISLLVPWGDGDTSLTAAVKSSFDVVSARLRKATPKPVIFDAGKAMASFLKRNDAFLPDSEPDGWDLKVGSKSMEVGVGDPVPLRMAITRGSVASALVAVRLVDRKTGEVFMSPLMPITVTGGARPTVSIVTPDHDLTGGARLPYTKGGSGNYTLVTLNARADDPEDGPLGGGSIVWTTDRTDIQDAILGEGESIEVRLYAKTCDGGAVHTITATARDSGGGEAKAKRVIEIGQPC